tara:strand:- start:211 stop:633 length:423 start_codon:yes stop_codon:yes gene_type:complete
MTELLTKQLERVGIGFDNWFDRLLASTENDITVGNFPPYNMITKDENNFILELALAGYNKENLDVEIKENVLIIAGKMEDSYESSCYRHKGIASRTFKKSWTLAEHIEVDNVQYKDGVLRVYLVREIPEEKKPHKISISD